MEETTEKHPSFGMAAISHVSGSTNLVGSNFKHQHYVQLVVSRGEKRRDLANEWWVDREKLIRVYLSEAQWVELISRPNIGCGVPCTLGHVMGERMPAPPEPQPLTEPFHRDMESSCKDAVAKLRDARKNLNSAIDEGRIGKTALRAIASDLRSAEMMISNGVPFIEKQFAEAMEVQVRHAAAEIEAVVTQTAIRLGLEEMRQIGASAPKLIENTEDGGE